MAEDVDLYLPCDVTIVECNEVIRSIWRRYTVDGLIAYYRPKAH